MNLTIDIGNTRGKAAVFEDGVLVQHLEWQQGVPPNFLAWATNHAVENVILSTVADRLPLDIRRQLHDHFRFFELYPTTPLPISHQYETPETLGKDRLAAVAGAYALFPEHTCLVVDAGTCITYDWINAEGTYLGGNIAPGIRMRLQAMHAFTDRLPAVEMQAESHQIGRSTAAALRNGAQVGAVLEVEGYRACSEAQFGPTRLVLTGGDADFLANKLKSEIFVNHHLVLTGLNQILEYNVKRLE